MKFNKVLVLATAAISMTFGCSQKQQHQFTSQKSEKWSSGQSVACANMNINGLLGLNGKDVYYFPKCLAGFDQNGEVKHFQATNSMMETIGIDAVSEAMELVKMNPTDEGGLPLMASLLVVMERGTVVEGKSNKALEDKMFGPFQDFLMGMDPYWSSHLALQMAQTGNLERVLDDLTPLVETIDMRPVFGNMNAILKDKDIDGKYIKDSVVYATKRVLDTPALYQSFRNILTYEPSRSIDRKSQKAYLIDWLDPQINDFEQVPIDQKNLVPDKRTGIERYNEFVAGLSDDEVKKMAKLSSVLFEKFANMDSEVRLSAIKKLFDGVSESYTEQAAPVRNVMALIDFLTNDAKTIDLQYVIQGITELLEGTGPEAILSVNHKVASSRLHTLADKMLYEGGRVPGCNLSLTGVRGGEVEDYSAIFDAIALFISPNSSCMHGLSPLASLVYSEIETSIGVQADCEGGMCFGSEELQVVAKSLENSNWNDLNDQAEADPVVIKELLVDILKEQAQLLSEDKYALYWDHLSIGAVAPSVVNQLVTLIQEKSNIDAKVIAELDNFIETSEKFRTYFHPQFLESILTNKIAHLSAVSEQFSDIFDDENDYKAEQIFSGTYLDGPVYQLLADGLGAPELQDTLQIPQIEFRIKELLNRLKRPGSIFKNKRFRDDEDRISLRYLGDPGHSVKLGFVKSTDLHPETGKKYYKYQGVEFHSSPLDLNKVFSEDYWRFEIMLLKNNLLGKDIPKGKSDQFIDWIENELYPYIASGIDWSRNAKQFVSAKAIDIKYYDVDSYSTDEMRRIALFYSKNFMTAPAALLPDDENSFHMELTRAKKTPNVRNQFLDLPWSRVVRKWSTFNRNYPNALASGNTLDSFLAQITKEQLLAIDWTGMPDVKNNRYELQGFNDADSEIVKVLSAFNLLTMNRVKQYMPFIAVGEYCHYKNKPEKCPITFIDSESDPSVTAMDSFRKYVVKMANSFTCPLVASTDPVFNSKMQLALDIDNFDSTRCSGVLDLFDEYENSLPEWLHRLVLTDLIAMGKKANLKPGLTTLSAKIRYHRLAKKYPRDLFQVMRGLSNTWSYLPARITAYAHSQMADHKGFLVYRPGFINVYINYLIKSIASDVYSDELMAHYGASVNVDQDLADGIGQSLINEVLVDTFNSIENKNVSVLDYLFRVIQKLALPQYKEHLEAIAHLVSYPQDLEALSTYTQSIPLLIGHYANYNLPQTFWQRPGNSIIRHIVLHQEKMRSLNDLLVNFDSEDIHSTIEVLVETFHIMGSSEEINILVKKFVDFLRDEMIACNNDGVGVVRILEENLRNIMLEDALDQDFRSINNIIHLMGQETTGFNGKKAAPLVEQIEKIVAFSIRKLPSFFWHYQDQMNKSNEKNDNYLYKLAHSLVDPLEGLLGDIGARALSAILSSSDMGSWDSLFRPLLFDKKYQKLLLNVMKASDKVELDDYQRALEETDRILPMANLYLNYVVDHTKWNGESSKYAMESMLRLSGQSGFVLDSQITLMNKWLTKEKKNK